MAGTKKINSDLDILGKVKVDTVPNNTGTVVTYNPTTKTLSQRTNTEIISDLGLITAANIAAAYYTKTQLQTSGQSQVHWGNISSKPTTIAGYGITNAMATTHAANAITTANITNWNTAFGWGNHSNLYLESKFLNTKSIGDANNITAGTQTNFANGSNKPLTANDGSLFSLSYSTIWSNQQFQDWRTNELYLRNLNNGTWGSWNKVWSDKHFTTTNISNWNTAFGWGNHALAGYAPGNHTHTQYVNKAGDTMTGNLYIGGVIGGGYYGEISNAIGVFGESQEIIAAYDTTVGVRPLSDGRENGGLYTYGDGILTIGSYLLSDNVGFMLKSLARFSGDVNSKGYIVDGFDNDSIVLAGGGTLPLTSIPVPSNVVTTDGYQIITASKRFDSPLYMYGNSTYKYSDGINAIRLQIDEPNNRADIYVEPKTGGSVIRMSVAGGDVPSFKIISGTYGEALGTGSYDNKAYVHMPAARLIVGAIGAYLSSTAYKLITSGSALIEGDLKANNFIKEGGTTSQLLGASGTSVSAGSGISISGTTISNTAPNIVQTLSLSGNTLTLSNGGGTATLNYAASSHTHTFASLTSKPTTISGYGITDAIKVIPTASLSNVSTSAPMSYTNSVWFDYNWAGSNKGGSVIGFSGLGGPYATEIMGNYADGTFLGFRTRNGDSNQWNPVRTIWHSGNIDPVSTDTTQIINGHKIFTGASGSEYHNSGIEIRPTLTNQFPTLGFHHTVNSYAGTIRLKTNVFEFQNAANAFIPLRSNAFIVNNGTGSEFLKADGTRDNSVYAKNDGTTEWYQVAQGLVYNNPTIPGRTLNNSNATVDLQSATHGSAMGIINTASLASGNPTDTWFHRIKMLHPNSAGYYTEIAVAMTGEEGLWFKKYEGGSSVKGWIRTVDVVNNQTIGGTKTFTSSITAPAFYESSLRELKENIKQFDKSGLELVDKLEIVTFDRKDSEIKNKIGIIADDSPKEFLSESLDSVDLYKTVFIQAKAIQELKSEVDELKELVKQLLNNK